MDSGPAQNNGVNGTLMVTGLGPLLDTENVFYTVDESGTPREQAKYADGGFYFPDFVKSDGKPILLSNVASRLRKPELPIAILTSFKTSSSAEAVVAIFAGQSNVKIFGVKTKGLTSTNSFNFLPDNAVLNWTVGFYANSNLEIYPQGIEQDFNIQSGDHNGLGSENDVVSKSAVSWNEDYPVKHWEHSEIPIVSLNKWSSIKEVNQ